jgi:hypothetical protein
MGTGGGGGRELDDVGDALKRAIEEATRGYSVAPPLLHARAGLEGGALLRDFLIEDSSLLGGYEAFTESTARGVKEELKLS